MIKNLNQLRRTLREGTQLEILDHCRPECIGQIRNITLVNTQGFYSTVANQPDASANRGNGGRGPMQDIRLLLFIKKYIDNNLFLMSLVTFRSMTI